ncbi:MAG TPA: hypothetical protein VKY74_28090 [Chloroflexia bacterium]|nr:hypothetical protein [Chloroflexia bacterium]
MKRNALALVQPDSAATSRPAPQEGPPESPLLHLRITGRHGVFLLEQSATAARTAVVDTRAAGGIVCTCPGPAGACEHVALLRACGFLAQAA